MYCSRVFIFLLFVFVYQKRALSKNEVMLVWSAIRPISEDKPVKMKLQTYLNIIVQIILYLCTPHLFSAINWLLQYCTDITQVILIISFLSDDGEDSNAMIGLKEASQHPNRTIIVINNNNNVKERTLQLKQIANSTL